MFGDFSDKDFALVIMSVERYNQSCTDLVNLTKDKEIPLSLVSSLVNIQRKQYNLHDMRHTTHRDLLLDVVISGSKYFFNSENLRLVLATLVTMCSSNKTIDVEDICRITREVKKFLSFKINYTYDISMYIETLSKFK